MDRRKFLLGLVGGLTAAAAATAISQQAEALPLARPVSPRLPETPEPAVATDADLEGVKVQDAQYYYYRRPRRRRYWRRRYFRPRRRYWRRRRW